jgi:hypothetical protein
VDLHRFKFINQDIYEGDPKITGIVKKKKKVFKIFVQILNFSLLQSNPPVTGSTKPSAAPTAGNTV